MLLTAVSTVLLAHGLYQFLLNPEWWVYVPVYSFCSLLIFTARPSSSLWRLFTSICIVLSGIYMLFLAWVFHSLEHVRDVKLEQGKQLMPIAVGVLLVSTSRITSDSKPTHTHQYIRSALLHFFFVMSTFCAVASIRYYL